MSQTYRTKPVILITDTDDNPITELDLGTITMESDTFRFRVWNNQQGFKAIPSAVSVKLDLKASPQPAHSLIMGDSLAFRGRCTYSAKQAGIYSENLQMFPLTNTDYDEIGSEEYNEYEVSLLGSNFNQSQKDILNGNEWKIYIIVNANRGVAE